MAIKNDDYRLLSLESIILHHIKREHDKTYGQDRLRSLSAMYCDSGKEFKSLLRSVKEFVSHPGTREIQGFDPGTDRISTTFGNPNHLEIYESYAVSQIKEEFNLQIIDDYQYKLAMRNLSNIYKNYAFIKRIFKSSKKDIDKLFTREYVYGFNVEEKRVSENNKLNDPTND